MIKDHYKKELSINNKAELIQKGNKGKEALKVQQWLNLWVYMRVGLHKLLTLDGDFGRLSKDSLEGFQRHFRLPVTGIVDGPTMRALTAPIKNAFEGTIRSTDLRASILEVCEMHLESYPRELKQNEGPWVRAYCNGRDGKNYPWCAGVATAIYDQAYSHVGLNFKNDVANSLSCDTIGNKFIKDGRLIRNADLRKMSDAQLREAVKPGDMFLVVKSKFDWTHTGIIKRVEDHIIHTYEGNTNDEGSREGYEFCRRLRDLKRHNIDVGVINV